MHEGMVRENMKKSENLNQELTHQETKAHLYI